MQLAYTEQSNEVSLPVLARASGDPITSGTVNFYLKDLETGNWFRGSDSSWQSAESLCGQAVHESDGHWILSVVEDAWLDGHKYRLYAKESGNLHIPVSDTIQCTVQNLSRILAAWIAGKWRDKSGSPGVYEILDPGDDSTVIMEVTPAASTPYKNVTIKI